MAIKTTPQDLAEQASRTYKTGDLSAAAQLFAEAAQAYMLSGDAANAAEMKNNQSVALLRNGQAQAALDATCGTESVFAGANDFRREGMALGNQASALEALKRYKDAIAAYQKSGDALAKAGEDDLRAEVMQLLSALCLRRFKFMDAVVALQSGLTGVKNPTPKQRLMKKILFIRL